MRASNSVDTARVGRPTDSSRSTLGQVLYRPPGWLLSVGLAALMVSTAALYWTATHFKLFTGMDAEVYRHGAEDLWHGRPLYESEPGALPFTYTPAAAVFFTPMRFLSPYSAAKALAAISLVCLFLIIWISLGLIGVAKGRGRAGVAACLTAAAVWLEPTMSNFQFSQINLVLLLLVIGDVATPDRHWRKGLWIGLATGIKLVPGLFIVYFIATKRWRAAAIACGTFAASVAVGFAAAPHDSIEYWSTMGSSVDRIRRSGQIWYVGNQSIHGLLLRMFGGAHGADLLWLVTAVAVAAGVVWLAARASALGNELLAALLVCLGGVLISPVSWTHHWVFVILFVPVITDAVWRWLTARPRATRKWYVWPALLLPLVFLEWPGPSDEFGGPSTRGLVFLVPHLYAIPAQGVDPELHWTWPQRLVGEAYTIAGLIFLIVCAAVLYDNSLRSIVARSTAERPQ